MLSKRLRIRILGLFFIKNGGKMEQLKENFKALIMEIKQEKLDVLNKSIIGKEHKVFKKIEISSTDFRINVINRINEKVLGVMLLDLLDKFTNQKLLKKVFDKLNEVAKYNFDDENFEKSMTKIPSIVHNYIIGIILKTIKIEKNYQLEIDLSNFDALFDELIYFLKEEYFCWEERYLIHGMIGEIPSIEVENIKIEKITLESQNLFEFFYNYANLIRFNSDFKIGNYYLSVKNRILKKDRFRYINVLGSNKINQIMKILLLSSNGNLKYGRGIRLSYDWTVLNSREQHVLNDSLEFKGNKDFYNLDKAENNIKNNLNLFIQEDFKLEESLEYAIERLKKSKQEIDINNKVVELALALEYSIKTNAKDDITKVLKEKSAILFKYETNTGYSRIKEKIYDFYDIRSRIMHGEKKYGREEEKVLRKIYLAEEVIRENILLLCKINQKKSLEEIDRYLEEIRLLKEKKSLKYYVENY